MAGQIVLVQTLHDYHDCAALLVVGARRDSLVEPSVDGSPLYFGSRLGWIEWIVDDDEVSTTAGQRALHACGQACSPFRSAQVQKSGARVREPRWEKALIPFAVHEPARVTRHLVRQRLRVTGTENFRGRVTTQNERRERD